MSTKNRKRILNVTVKRMIDGNPDTSWLGEYSNRAETEFAIDRAHSEDCIENDGTQKEKLERISSAIQDFICEDWIITDLKDAMESITDAQDTLESIVECDCGEHGDMKRGEHRYFNPGTVERFKPDAEWLAKYPIADRKAEWHKAMKSNAKQDYNRMQGLDAGNWSYIGIKAEAEISIPSGQFADANLTQEISSAGLWGIESDSERSYFESVGQEELSELKSQLTALGFSRRAIATAFKDVQYKDGE